jgi:hypothetical protein
VWLLLVSGDRDQLYSLGPTKLLPPKDGDRIQSEQRRVIVHHYLDYCVEKEYPFQPLVAGTKLCNFIAESFSISISDVGPW